MAFNEDRKITTALLQHCTCIKFNIFTYLIGDGQSKFYLFLILCCQYSCNFLLFTCNDVRSHNPADFKLIWNIHLYFCLFSFCNCLDQLPSVVEILLILTSFSNMLTIQIFAVCKFENHAFYFASWIFDKGRTKNRGLHQNLWIMIFQISHVNALLFYFPVMYYPVFLFPLPSSHLFPWHLHLFFSLILWFYIQSVSIFFTYYHS